MRSKDIENKKILLKLTKRQRSILIGTILGDGHLETQNMGRTYRLKIEHTIKQNFYVDWMYEQFNDWVLTSPKSKLKVVNNVSLENYYFQTVSVGQFRFYAKQFYVNGRKTIPQNISHWLTPLALSVWFMDDGSLKSKFHKALIFNTHSFKRKELEILRKALKDKYGIDSLIRYQKDGLQLMVVGENAELLVILIRLYILPGFNYKLGLLVNNLPKEYRRRSKVS